MIKKISQRKKLRTALLGGAHTVAATNNDSRSPHIEVIHQQFEYSKLNIQIKVPNKINLFYPDTIII